MQVKEKKSGMSIDRAINIQERLKKRISDIFGRTIAYKLTWDELHELLFREISESQSYKKAPAWVHSFLKGYMEARKEEIHRHHTAWLLWVDGQLMTRKDVDTIAAQESAPLSSPDPNFKGVWSRIDNDKSRHVWKDGNAVYRDKPFDRKWVEVPKDKSRWVVEILVTHSSTSYTMQPYNGFDGDEAFRVLTNTVVSQKKNEIIHLLRDGVDQPYQIAKNN